MTIPRPAIPVVCALALLASASSADAQTGRSFVFAIPPFASARVGSGEHILSVVAPQRGEIRFIANEGGEPVLLELAPGANRFELDALFGDRVVLPNAEGRSTRSFRIETTVDVSIVVLSVDTFSGDAMLLLPIDALGRDYVVMAWPNGFTLQAGTPGSYDMPSQFAVVALDDGTTVTMQRADRGGAVETVVLERGDVHLAQATLGAHNDVTGTRVTATKPVALFAGTRRASVPARIGNHRDYLVEQLQPVSSWGSETYVVPPPRPRNRQEDTAYVRLMTAEAAVVEVDGNGYRVGPPIPVELPLTGPMRIVSSAPFETMVYMPSGAFTAGQDSTLNGDPSMVLAVPTSQYALAVSFESIARDEFDEHWVTAIVPDGAALWLDGAPLNVQMTQIAGSSHRYAHIPVSEGLHVLQSSLPFGATVVGYGPGVSYAYPAAAVPVATVSVADEADRSFEISIHPNPVAAELTVAAERGIASGSTIDIVDVAGRLRLRRATTAPSGRALTLDVAALEPGIYALRVVGADGRTATRRIVIAR